MLPDLSRSNFRKIDWRGGWGWGRGAEGEGLASIQPFPSAQGGGERPEGGQPLGYVGSERQTQGKGLVHTAGLGAGARPPAVTEAAEEGRVLPAGTTYQVIPDAVPQDVELHQAQLPVAVTLGGH